MLTALTANINRAEKTEPISHNAFLRYPAADVQIIPGLSADAAAISLSLVPPKQLAMAFLELRERVAATYIWRSDQWLSA